MIVKLSFVGVTNNLETYEESGVHYVSIIMQADEYEGVPKIMEPHKCSELIWRRPDVLPNPQFDASRMGVQCFINKMPYLGSRDL